MTTKTLFLAWQDKKVTRQWFPVGQLDVDLEAEPNLYRFRYINGAKRAQEEAKFPLLIEFPELEADYYAHELFPLFMNRVIAPSRPDRLEYLQALDLNADAGPVEILSVNGGYRMTDVYEVFPKLIQHDDGEFACRFFLHGWRYVNPSAQQRMNLLEDGEELYVTMELTNPVTRIAVQIQTTDYHVIGWAPRYLMADLAVAMAEAPEYSAQVVRVNPLPPPSRQRVLIEMRGRWNEHKPMESGDYVPMVP